jgi:hypothetical protein
MNKLFTQNKAKLKKTDKVTTKSLDRHREDVLKRGKRFRYPIQYAKHHLVLIALSIGAVVIVGFGAALWGFLYLGQDTGDIAFRITQILPFPVARVDGELVNYGDYLILYRSSIKPIERQSGTYVDVEDAASIRSHYKRMSLDEAEKFAYASKLAKGLGVSVSREEVAELSREYRVVNGVEKDETSFMKIIYDNFGLRTQEYDRLIEMSALKRKVAAEIDDAGNNLTRRIQARLAENGGDMETLASDEALGGGIFTETVDVKEGDFNLDGGRAEVARGLEVGEISDKFISKNGDSFYIVKLNSRDGANFEYSSIEIPFTEFEQRFSELKSNGKIREFINIEG